MANQQPLRVRLESRTGKSLKFWSVEAYPEHGGWIVKRTWGRIGTDGQKPKVSTFGTGGEAVLWARQRIAEKVSRGYQEIEGHFANPEEDVPQPTEADLAYESDRWTRYAWDWYLGKSEEGIPIEWIRDIPGFDALSRELFGRALGELTPLEDPVLWAAACHARCDQVGEWRELRELVQGDRWEAGEVAMALSERLYEEWPKEGISGQAQGQGEPKDGEGAPSDGEGEGEEEGAKPDLLDGIDAVRQRVTIKAACTKAMDDVEDMRAAMNLLGWSTDGTGSGKAANHEDKAKLARFIKKHPLIVELARRVGRMQRLFRRSKKQIVRHTKTQIARIGTGADLARTLPSELARLKHPTTRLDFMRRYVERSTLVYELEGVEELGRGPLVVCLDVSGSMSGRPDLWAKALALTLVRHALDGNRPAAIITFDSYVRHQFFARPGAEMNQDQLAQLIDDLPGGGTAYQPPLDQAVDFIDGDEREWRKADVVLITDGICGVDDRWLERWTKWRAEKTVRAFCLLVNVSSYYGSTDLQTGLVDETVLVSDIAGDNDPMLRFMAGVAA